jgi:hypothetical protein
MAGEEAISGVALALRDAGMTAHVGVQRLLPPGAECVEEA